jgi:ribonucleoside-diphosphate reductase alpha chain
LESLIRKFAHQRFEPSGFTRNPEIRNASSIIDYVFRWMGLQFIPGYREATSPKVAQPELDMPGLQEELKKKLNRPVPDLPRSPDTEIMTLDPEPEPLRKLPAPVHGRHAKLLTATFQNQGDAPTCPSCGHIAVRNGACYKCLNCGESLGCS